MKNKIAIVFIVSLFAFVLVGAVFVGRGNAGEKAKRVKPQFLVTSEHDKIWKKTQDENTISAYNGYIDRYPKGSHIAEAKKNIAALINERQPEFRAVKRARILVTQNYGDADKVSLPFKADMERLLRYAGVEPVGPEIADYDLTVKIDASGTPHKDSYNNGAYHFYTSASLKTAIAFSTNDGQIIKETCDCYGSSSYINTKHDSPNGAPFNYVYHEVSPKIGCFECILLFMNKTFGLSPLIGAMKDDCLSAAAAIVKIKEPAMQPLITALKNDKTGYCAVGAIVKIKEPAVDYLIAALKDNNASIRSQAAIALGEIRDPRAVEPLIAALKDAGSVGSAVDALGKIKDPRAVEPLLAVLNHRDWLVRNAAADVIRNIEDPRAVEPLIAALNSKQYFVREIAVETLGKIKDSRAVEPLIIALNDLDIIRQAAAKALGEIRDPRAVVPLIATLKNKDAYSRELAAEALGKIKDSRAEVPLAAIMKDKDSSVRLAAAAALDEIKRAAVVKP